MANDYQKKSLWLEQSRIRLIARIVESRHFDGIETFSDFVRCAIDYYLESQAPQLNDPEFKNRITRTLRKARLDDALLNISEQQNTVEKYRKLFGSCMANPRELKHQLDEARHDTIHMIDPWKTRLLDLADEYARLAGEIDESTTRFAQTVLP